MNKEIIIPEERILTKIFLIRGEKVILDVHLAELYGVETRVYIMEMLTTLFRAKLTTGLADFWVAANAIKACTKIVI